MRRKPLIGSILITVVYATIAITEHLASGQESTTDELLAEVREVFSDQDRRIQLGVIALDEEEQVILAHQQDKMFPTASSIKYAILLAFFREFEETLDQPANLLPLFSGDSPHPAIAHFDREGQTEIAESLHGKSAREIGWIMVCGKPSKEGESVSNRVYNAACNVAIASLGGPQATTRKIHALHESFAEIQVNRYMLASRLRTDNVATPKALASVFQVTSKNNALGFNQETAEEIQDIITSLVLDSGARLYAKGGALTSNPAVSVRAGRYQNADGKTLFYAVMVAQPLTSEDNGIEVQKTLAELSLEVYQKLMDVRFIR